MRGIVGVYTNGRVKAMCGHSIVDNVLSLWNNRTNWGEEAGHRTRTSRKRRVRADRLKTRRIMEAGAASLEGVNGVLIKSGSGPESAQKRPHSSRGRRSLQTQINILGFKLRNILGCCDLKKPC